jgi:FHS family L-fucose permease-like MFS transporter
MWGFITVFVDSLVPRLREVFELDYSSSGLFQTAFFLAYGILAIPSGYILSKIGYKKGIVLGLIVVAIGCGLYYPAASGRMFSMFLMAFFTVAGGMTILQVAANPYITVLGEEKGASARLNLAQAFNSLGTAIAPTLGAILILSDHVKDSDTIAALPAAEKATYLANEAEAVQQPFLILAIILVGLAVLFMFVPLPQIIGKRVKGGFDKVFSHKRLTLGALGIFVYVGAEVAIGTYAVSYFVDMDLRDVVLSSDILLWWAEFWHDGDLTQVDDKGIMGLFVSLYWLGAMVGRFVGAYLTYILKPSAVLSIFALGAITMLFLSFSTTGVIAMVTLLCVGLFNSIMFPTIFSLGIDKLGKYKPQGSGILCAAIVGGAAIPPLYGKITDMSSFKTGFLLLMVCYAYILFYGWYCKKWKGQALEQPESPPSNVEGVLDS